MTKEQKKVCETLYDNNIKNIQVIAGAGSGKTYTLINTIALCQQLNPTNSIGVITFSRKAANEISKRLASKQIQVKFTGTIHAFCYRFIKAEGLKFQLISNQNTVLKELFKKYYPQGHSLPFEFILKQKSLEVHKHLNKIYAQYKHCNSLLDFNNLVSMATKLLSLETKERPFTYLFIDEFQDTSERQLQLVSALKAEKLFVVGDEKQSIYGFRDAKPELFRTFSKLHSQTKRLELTYNFRSQKKIIQLANRFITNSKENISKKLKATIKKGIPPICYIDTFSKGHSERIKKYLSMTDHKEVVVLVRTNFVKKSILREIPSLEIRTIHSVKGLEFENIVIYGVVEDLIPHKLGELEEEKRLFYVAMTRAKMKLDFICWDKNSKSSCYLPFLIKNCKVKYLPKS